MKILSKFKDYYDYVSHIYGVDERVVYERKPLSANVVLNYKEKLYKNFYNSDSFRKKVLPYTYRKSIKYIVIIDTLFTLELVKVDRDVIGHYVLNESLSGMKIPELLELTKHIGIPVYSFEFFNYKLNVDNTIPILGNYGIPKLLSAEQAYQNIEYFLLNTINKTPDIKPPVEISDKDKIVGHGFDLKQSFRHRK